MSPNLRTAVLLFGSSLGSMHSLFLRPLLGTQHDLSWPCAIQPYKFTYVHLYTGTTGKASTPTSLTEQEQQMNKVDRLTRQLQMMTNERNELSIMLANFTNNDLNNRLNFELEMLNMEHKKVMVDLEKFPNEISEALNKCKELTEETVSCSILHSQLLSEWTHLKEKVSILREENRKLRGEQISLQESCEEMRRLCGEAHEKIYDLWAKEKQKQERLEERLQYLLKQRDLVTKHKVLAEKLQHYFTVSQMSTT
ncbi:disks large homolog 5-like isoform X3 [Peromyscus leucopus]|uniref:disks large homolog 5-like isoform X3 n=2 Tax=Peromyscus leucopus TaxID=10041 RepID=UPI0018854D0F|nr:disks large homolog 5-like isoform X3 [Peromyscus leucopus]